MVRTRSPRVPGSEVADFAEGPESEISGPPRAVPSLFAASNRVSLARYDGNSENQGSNPGCPQGVCDALDRLDLAAVGSAYSHPRHYPQFREVTQHPFRSILFPESGTWGADTLACPTWFHPHRQKSPPPAPRNMTKPGGCHETYASIVELSSCAWGFRSGTDLIGLN